MSITRASSRPRIVVVPRPLAGFFDERLSRAYDGRPEVRVIVDRREGERRAAVSMLQLPERRKADRRANAVYWNLGEMPFTAAVGDERALRSRGR